MNQAEKDAYEELMRKIEANITVVPKGTMRSYDDDPVFLKKDEEMIEAIKKNPFPDDIQKLIRKS